MLIFGSYYSSRNPGGKKYSAVLNIYNNYNNNNKCFLNSYNHLIRTISEGSCNNEEWSNDAESFDHRNILHFKIYSNRKQLF